MEYGNSAIGLYDLIAPLIGGTQSAPPMPTMGVPQSDASEVWGGPVQPSRTDTFTDKLIGGDRYGDLGDEARKRALSMAIMSLGQSLSQAAGAGRWSGPGGKAEALTNALPRALGTFEQRLAGEEQQRQQVEDRQYTLGQREYQKGQQERNVKEQEFEDIARKARNDAAPDAIADAQAFMDSLQVDPEFEDAGKVEAAKADLKFNLRMIEGVVKRGGNVSREQYQAVQAAKDRLATVAGVKEEQDRKDALELYSKAKEAGVRPEDVTEQASRVFGIQNKRIHEELRRIELENEKRERDISEDRERDKILKDMTPEQKRDYLLGIGRVYDPFMDRTYSAPRQPGQGRDVYAEQLIQRASEDRGVQQILGTDFSKTPSVTVQSPETSLILGQLGLRKPVGSTITAAEAKDLYDRLSVRPSGSDRSPAGGVQFSAPASPDRSGRIAEARRRFPELAQKSDDEVWQLILKAAEAKRNRG